MPTAETYSSDDIWNVIEDHVVRALKQDTKLGTAGTLAIATWEQELPEDVGVYQSNALPAVAVEVTSQGSEEIVGIPDLVDWSWEIVITVVVAGGELALVKAATKRYVARIIRCILQQHRTAKQLDTLTAAVEGAETGSVRVQIASAVAVAGRVNAGAGLRGVGEVVVRLTMGMCVPQT